ncbi:MAG: hypothetical protein V7731_23960 [Amphritea sp.]
MVKNTWDAVNEYYRLLLEKEPARVKDLVQQWTDGFQSHPLKGFFDPEGVELDYETPLEAYRGCLAIGIIPPPKVQLGLELCFDTYTIKRGTVEYEELFHGERKSKVGNHSAQIYTDSVYSAFHEEIEMYDCAARLAAAQVEDGEELTLTSKVIAPAQASVAKSFLDKNPEIWPDVDSFLRGYRRWREQQKKAK